MRMTFQYRLYPNKAQRKQLEFTLERCRMLYNRLLEERILAYRLERQSLSYYDQANTFSERKAHIPALKQVHSQVLQDVARRLDKAFQAFFRRVKSGETPGFPRFKPPQRYDSFTYPQGGYAIRGNKLQLSKIGALKIKLHRPIAGQVKTCTIVRKNGHYYACFSCECVTQPLPASSAQVGVDLGLLHLAATSEGETFAAPKHLCRNEKRLKQLQRAVSRKQRGSRRRKKAVGRLARLHERIANQRKESAHQISRQLVDRNGLIAFEQLNTQGMLKNHHLAKSIADAGWAQLVQYTTYKAERAGRVVVQVNPHHTSQICSHCGQIVKKTLAIRTHRCENCGYTADRDVNAAINILQRARAAS